MAGTGPPLRRPGAAPRHAPPGGPPRPWRRRAARVALLAALLLHLLVGRQVAELITPLNPHAPTMPRIQAAYTRSLRPAEALVARAPTARPPASRAPARPGVAQARALSAEQAALERAALRDRALAAVQAALAASAVALAAPAGTAPAASAAPSPATASPPSASPLAAASAPPGAPPAAASSPPGAPAAPVSAQASAASGAGPALASGAALAASGPAPLGAAAASASAAAAIEPAEPPMLAEGLPWPRSTRLTYALHGWYGGDVYGQAQVEWLRQGWRYQVHLDVSFGPSLAPLASRRMSSEGRISERGLVPQRYLQVTRQIIGRTRSARIGFEADEIVLDRGQRVPQQPQVQDTASQFIQMIYLFTAQPALQEAGRSIEFPLAMPHRVDRWTYDVGRREPVTTPVGVLEAFHVKPRRAVSKGDLSVEVWYAPRLQLLPVRILIRQDENTWVDLQLEKAPEQ